MVLRQTNISRCSVSLFFFFSTVVSADSICARVFAIYIIERTAFERPQKGARLSGLDVIYRYLAHAIASQDV